MIKLYAGNDTALNYCEIVINPIKAEIYKDKEEYYATIEIPLNYTSESGRTVNYAPYLVQDEIAVINTPWGEQPFRLNNSEKSLKSINVKAQHIVCDLKKYVIKEAYTELFNLNGAISEAFSRGNVGSEFTFSVNTSRSYIYNMVTYSSNNNDYNTMTVFDALQTISKIWGVQIVVDKRNITFKDYPAIISSDIVLRNAKNIDDIRITESWDNVCTKCLAIGYRDLRNEYTTVNRFYPCRYDKVIEFEPTPGVNQDDDAAIIVDLGVQAQNYVESHLDPEINYEVSATPDADVDVGDPVSIKHKTLGVDIMASVISVTYNALTGRYTKVEFGNYRPNIKGFAKLTNLKIGHIIFRLNQGGIN